MAIFGSVEDALGQTNPEVRLWRGLKILADFRAGRAPEISRAVESQKEGTPARIPLEGDSLYLLVQCYQPRPREQGRFEAHRDHTDLQYLCDGQEWIEVSGLEAQHNLPAYDANGNLYFPIGDAMAHTRLLLRTGELAVLFPGEAHAACLQVDGTKGQLVRKIVVKMKHAHLHATPVSAG